MYSQIESNKRKTWLVMAGFLVILAIIGWLIAAATGEESAAWIVLGVGLIYAVVQYFFASRMAVFMSGAREISKSECPRLYNAVENLSITTGLPMPKVYLIDDSSPNAFATGRDPDHAIVAATRGLVDMMTDRELVGVMAHEMAHVGNYDIRVSLIAFALTAAISAISDLILRTGFRSSSDDDDSRAASVLLIIAAVIAPLVATLIQLAVSRRREYLADATASLTTRDPEGLASALEKLRQDNQPLKRVNSSMANMYIKNPLKKGFFSNLLSTHPPIEDRIAQLRGMENQF